jgi:lysophospholipase L1-like esterase
MPTMKSTTAATASHSKVVGTFLLQSRLVQSLAFLLAMIGVIVLIRQEDRAVISMTSTAGSSTITNGKATTSTLTGSDGLLWKEMPFSNSDNRCIDDDDPVAILNLIPMKQDCHCPDATAPSPRQQHAKAWTAHYQLQVEDVAHSAVDGIDVALLGDSITERWNGTRSMGQPGDPEVYQVFAKHFRTDPFFRGVALGTAGDVSMELLWRIQHGVLPTPKKAFVVLIGTNDLGRYECSKHTVLRGIVAVLEYLVNNRPGIPIVVHALLPRSDHYQRPPHEGDYALGRYWTNNIVWINGELEKLCQKHTDLEYMDVNEIFLVRSSSSSDAENTTGAVSINSTLMPDALHPGVDGYALWAPLIVQRVHVLSKNKP